MDTANGTEVSKQTAILFKSKMKERFRTLSMGSLGVASVQFNPYNVHPFIGM